MKPIIDTDSVFAEGTRSPVLAPRIHAKLLEDALGRAELLHRVETPFVAPAFLRANDVHSLAQWQTGFQDQGDRGSCWAFAGIAALEAAYRRRFGIVIDASEEYAFHVGKAFALTLDANGFAAPVENNTSLTGFQGSGDIVQKLTESAVPLENTAQYLSQGALEAILPTLGYAGVAALTTQEDFDALEFCEQHIPLLARVNARYRATGWKSLGGSPSVQDLENTLLSNHEVVCDVTHLTNPMGGHVLLLIGYDRTRKVFTAKNSWGENAFIEIQYANDPNWRIESGYYITDVVDPTFVQNEACWVGNWWLTRGGNTARLLIRRAENLANPNQPTKLGNLYAGNGKRDVNGTLTDNGAKLTCFIAPNSNAVKPGTLSGDRIEAHLNFADIYNASGSDATGQKVVLSRFATRFAALWEPDGGIDWQARHGLTGQQYQQTFDDLNAQGYRPEMVCGYSEGRDARYAAVWSKRVSATWVARHGLTGSEFQQEFDDFVSRGFRLTNVSGYAIDGEARYTGIWEQSAGPAWQARHGLTAGEYQQTFDQLTAQGYVPEQVCGYRVNVAVRFAAIWAKRDVGQWEARHGLTASQYQKKFDELQPRGMRPVWVSGYSDTGIARYAAIWRKDTGGIWQARHGLDPVRYQQTFDALLADGLRPVQVSGYGDGFYPA